MVELGLAPSLSHETVRLHLKKTPSRRADGRWGRSGLWHRLRRYKLIEFRFVLHRLTGQGLIGNHRSPCWSLPSGFPAVRAGPAHRPAPLHPVLGRDLLAAVKTVSAVVVVVLQVLRHQPTRGAERGCYLRPSASGLALLHLLLGELGLLWLGRFYCWVATGGAAFGGRLGTGCRRAYWT